MYIFFKTVKRAMYIKYEKKVYNPLKSVNRKS